MRGFDMYKKSNDSKIWQIFYFKRFTLWFLIGIVGSFICIGLVTYVEDPMHFYRYDPTKGIYHDARRKLGLLEWSWLAIYIERWQSYGLAHSFPHNFLVIGTSTARFPLSAIDETFRAKSIRANISNANFSEASMVIRESKADRVLFMCNQMFGQDDAKNIFPTEWYQKVWYRHISYCLKIDMFLASVRYIANRMLGYKNGICPDEFSIESYGTCGKESVLCAYKDFLKDWRYKTYQELEHMFNQRIQKFDSYIVRTLQTSPQKTFYVILPPSHILFHKKHESMKCFDLYMKVRRHIVQSLLSLKNVKIFDMESDTRLTTDFNAYPDMAHHKKSHYLKMLEFIKKGENLITPQNVEIFHQRFEKSVKSNKFYGE